VGAKNWLAYGNLHKQSAKKKSTPASALRLTEQGSAVRACARRLPSVNSQKQFEITA